MSCPGEVPGSSLWRAALLALCLLAAWHSKGVVRAEHEYAAGTGYTDDPSRDVPGRLERYERALELDPDNSLYMLRIGQIRLGRALEAGSREDVRSVVELSSRAARVQPLDARVATLHARALAVAGDISPALDEMRRALRVGPRHPSVQSALVRAALAIWTSRGQQEALRVALEIEAYRLAWYDGARPVGVDTRGRAGVALVDGLLAVAPDDAALLSVGALWLERRPDLLPVLEAAIRRAREQESR